MNKFLLFTYAILVNISDFASIARADDMLSNKNSLLKPENVAVVVNDQDANSVEVGKYYLNARNIPLKNLITVSLKSGVASISEEQFISLREKIYANLNPDIQVITLIWSAPYAVNCNSITSAITLGLDLKQCENGCAVGRKNPYFNSASSNPTKDLNIRLSILLPTDSIPLAKSLIDRGVLSSFKMNDATGYFLMTDDGKRSGPREKFFPRDLTHIPSKKLYFRTLKSGSIKDKKDVMFYFIGASNVPYLETLNFMPGAIADHLTSFGGILEANNDTSSLKWLAAGATGSYGSVSEPCNYWQKFPNPRVLLAHYLTGETLIESYWKSVYWPTQGLFIGEPLAAPYHN